jgi:UDP-N-acetylglucosamine 2-epimerase (non-hydrolysing)
MIIFGTRPEAIKLCPLINELKKHSSAFKTIVCVSAQHREMLDQFLTLFKVSPDYDLNLMQENQTVIEITSRVLTETSKVLEQEKPDILLVQGDTTTTFSSSLAAFYQKISIGHVEAGLRTGNKYSPFPEEINRTLTGAMADLHFAATTLARDNLLAENVPAEKIIVTGNTVIDALFWVREKIRAENKNYNDLFSAIDFNKRIILVTGHRRENFGQGFINLCNAFKSLAQSYPDVEIVYPVHLNPNVKKPVYQYLARIPNIKLLEPLEYEPFIYLMDKCYFIITDSGGIQEEAPSLGKPVLVTRNSTERPEAVDVGVAKLVGTDKNMILKEAIKLLTDPTYYDSVSHINNPYGDGHASQRIIDVLLNYSY